MTSLKKVIGNMTEHDWKVERQRKLIAAEEWSRGVKSMHAHSMSSMWYDNRPEDTANGKSVIDIEYNGGLIKRILDSGKTIYFGERLRGDELIDAYLRVATDTKKGVSSE